MHFMNPPPIMKLIEIVRGAETSDETFSVTKALAERFACSHKYIYYLLLKPAVVPCHSVDW